mgnify:CR=1 FL=1
MAEFNLFGADAVRNMQRGGQQVWEDTGANLKEMRNQFTNARAGGAYARGDRQGAANMLAQGGNIDGARTLENDIQGDERQAMLDQQAAEQQTYQRGRDKTTDQAAKAKENLGLLQQLYRGARQIPWQSEDSPNPGEKRFAFLQKTLPILQQAGFDVTPFSQLTPEQLDDQNIDTFGGQVEEELIKLPGGGLGTYNPQTRKYTELRKPDAKPPGNYIMGPDGEWMVNPLVGQAAAARRAPQRARSGGGGSGGARAGGKPKSYSADDVTF